MSRVTLFGEHRKVIAVQDAVTKAAGQLGGKFVGCGTELASMTRDLEYRFKSKAASGAFAIKAKASGAFDEVVVE
jgi:hypothetical protein